jgi:UDP-glucose 4-epimerase
MPDEHLSNLAQARSFLVTGASGFIGNAVCKRLLGLGAKVCGTSRSSVEFDHEQWHHIRADLANVNDVEKLFAASQPEFVIHLASCVTGKRELEWVLPTFAGNLQSAVNILVTAQDKGIGKTVLAGSLEEPDGDDPAPLAASPYAASKWCASTYARMMHALYGTKSVVARIFMVYGPGQQDLAKLVPYVCISAAKGAAPKLMSGGRPVDWIYIDDVVNGLIALALAGPEEGSYVDLGSGELTTTGDVASRICMIAGTGVSPELGALPDRAMEQVRSANVRKSGTLLDWAPVTDLDTGLERTYEWYRELALGQD